MSPAIEKEMARALGADSLKYLSIDAIARCVDKPRDHLCQACIDGRYPTSAGRRLYQLALDKALEGSCEAGRTYESTLATGARM